MPDTDRLYQWLPLCMPGREKNFSAATLRLKIFTIFVHQNRDFLYFVLSRLILPICILAVSFIGILFEFGYILWTGILIKSRRLVFVLAVISLSAKFNTNPFNNSVV